MHPLINSNCNINKTKSVFALYKEYYETSSYPFVSHFHDGHEPFELILNGLSFLFHSTSQEKMESDDNRLEVIHSVV